MTKTRRLFSMIIGAGMLGLVGGIAPQASAHSGHADQRAKVAPAKRVSAKYARTVDYGPRARRARPAYATSWRDGGGRYYGEGDHRHTYDKRERKRLRRRARAKFRRLDRNDDGIVTRREFRTWSKNRRRRFVRMDRDGDGCLTRREFVSAKVDRRLHSGRYAHHPHS